MYINIYPNNKNPIGIVCFPCLLLKSTKIPLCHLNIVYINLTAPWINNCKVITTYTEVLGSKYDYGVIPSKRGKYKFFFFKDWMTARIMGKRITQFGVDTVLMRLSHPLMRCHDSSCWRRVTTATGFFFDKIFLGNRVFPAIYYIQFYCFLSGFSSHI